MPNQHVSPPQEEPQTAAFTCPRCGMKSYHPRDLAEGYCGNCHDFTGEPRKGQP